MEAIILNTLAVCTEFDESAPGPVDSAALHVDPVPPVDLQPPLVVMSTYEQPV